MFGERIEVLEYRQKFEVELSTFPDTTNTETSRKLVFRLTCVRLSVCAKKFVSEYLTNEVTDLNEKFRYMLPLASNRKPPLASMIGPIFPHNLGRRVIFEIL